MGPWPGYLTNFYVQVPCNALEDNELFTFAETCGLQFISNQRLFAFCVVSPSNKFPFL